MPFGRIARRGFVAQTFGEVTALPAAARQYG
jgi:hypothetical protein